MFDRIGKDTKVFAYYVFVALVIAWTANRTLDAVRSVIPNDSYAPYIALGLFDAGALGWLSAFLGHAKGTQRTIAFWMTWASLAGIALMVAGALGLIDAEAIKLTLTGATVCNVFAAYAYHITSPANKEQIETQNLEDTLEAEALQIARADIERQAKQLGRLMANRVTARIKYRLTLPMTEAERKEWKANTVEGEVKDIEADSPALPGPQAAPMTFTAWLKAIPFFGRGRRPQAPQSENEPITTSTSNGSGSEESTEDNSQE